MNEERIRYSSFIHIIHIIYCFSYQYDFYIFPGVHANRYTDLCDTFLTSSLLPLDKFFLDVCRR